ncbi:AraC family transcriptional regulator [Paraburkholderia sediminicola]|uniref:AraC family transcriptional regulator n=2 Tax=Paraburkholderia sediminicola TaxID=458836 RepID=UPI0038B9D371
MSVSEYQSRSLEESTEILSREWSRHSISIPRNEQIDLQFCHRSIGSSMSLSYLSYGASVAITPCDRADVLLVEMPLRGRARVRYKSGEVEMNPGRIGIIDVKRVIGFEAEKDFETVVLRVGTAHVRCRIEKLLDTALHGDLTFALEIVEGTQTWESWAPMSGLLRGMTTARRANCPPQMLKHYEDAIMAALIFGQPHSFSERIRQPASLLAPRHVRKVEEYVYAHASEPLSTPLLAAYANVSVRALFDGFRTFRNVTPAEFVRNVRLDKARVDLQDGSLPILAIAKKWGFGHGGNFAAHYRRRFGEAPADSRRLQRDFPSQSQNPQV